MRQNLSILGSCTLTAIWFGSRYLRLIKKDFKELENPLDI